MKNTAYDWAATHEYQDDEFEIECPNCKKINIITTFKQDGHIGPEECSCANCHHILGTFHASNTPKVRLKSNE